MGAHVALAILLASLGTVAAHLAPAPGNRPWAARDIYCRLLAATGWVHASEAGKGTGWLLDTSRRHFVTAWHVVGDSSFVEVFFPVWQNATAVADRGWYLAEKPALVRNGHVVRGRVVRRDKDNDLALIELEALPPDVAALPLANETPLPGDRVHTVGCRYDVASLWSYASGNVRQVRTLKEGYFNGGRQLAKGARAIVAQLPINEGDSGGALVNWRCEVVGVAAAVAWELQGAGLFIDVGALRKLTAMPGLEVHAEAMTGPGVAVYRQALSALALVQTAPDEHRCAAWVVDRNRRLLLTTAEAVGKQETVDLVFPVSQSGRVVSEFAFYRANADALLARKHRVRGCVLALDARRNLALLEAEALPESATALALAAGAPSPGDALHALGNSARLDVLWIYTACWLRQVGPVNLGASSAGPDPAVLVLQAPMAEGEGGGPLLDDAAAVVGVVAGRAGPQQQVCYAVSAAEVQAFLADAAPRRDPRTAAELCARGELFVAARLYSRAAADYAAALTLNPKEVAALTGRAKVLFLLGDDAQARTDCDAALALDATFVAAYCQRAAVCLRAGDVAGARADADRALALNAQHAESFALRADARRLAGDLDGARRDADEAVWLDRKLPAAYLARGRALARLGETEKAAADFTQAIALDPHRGEAHRERGEVAWARSDVQAALADFTRALELDLRDVAALLGRGRCRMARADDTGALADYEQALRLRPALIANVLNEIARRAADLSRAENANPAACCDICRRGLRLVQTFLQERPDVSKTLAAGLARATTEANPRTRADALRQLVDAVRDEFARPPQEGKR